MSDDEIIRRVWQAQIPTEINVRSNGANSKEHHKEYPNYYCQLYRNSYLPMYYNDILEYYRNFGLDINTQKVWFTYNDTPLKWNYPVGLIYDYVVGHHTNENAEQHEEDSKIWKLVINMGDIYPSEVLPFKQSIEYYWMNQIKESCYVLNGSSKNVMSLSKDDSANLWKYAREIDYKEFNNIYFRKIASKNPLEWRRIPIKVYFPSSGTQNPRIIQEIVSPQLYTNEESRSDLQITTLQVALHKCIPELKECKTACRILIHGIAVDLHTPLGELYQLLMFNDGFLHICVFL